MIRLPRYWGITVAAGLFNAGVWGAVAFLVLPTAWAVGVSGVAFIVTFWILSLVQSLAHESSRPRRVEVRPKMSDRMDILIH